MLLFYQPTVGTSIVHVQDVLGPCPASATTVSDTLAAVGVGNTVVGFIVWQGSVAPTSIADDKGNSYAVIDVNLTSYSSLTFWCSNITNGPSVITATWAASVQFPQITASEYSNVKSLDAHIFQSPVSGTATDAITSGNMTTAQNGDVIWGACFNSAGSLATSAGTGFTQRTKDTSAANWGVISEDKTQTAAGTTAATFTSTVSTNAYAVYGVALSSVAKPILHVQSAYGSMPSGVTTTTVTLAAVGVGNAVVGMIVWQGSIAPTSITDDKGNSYTVLDSASGSYSTITFWCSNITNGPTVITATWAASTLYPQIVASEYSNVKSLDGHSMQAFPFSPGGGTDALTSGSFTTTKNGDLIWGMSFNPSDAAATIVGTGFTQRVVDPGDWCVVGEDKTQASAGSVAATFTAGVSTHSYGIAGIALANS